MKKLLCARRRESDESFWSEGSVFHHRCADCAEPVVVGKDGQNLLASDKEVTIICADCALTNLPPDTEFRVRPGAIEEAKRYFRKKSH